MSPLETFNVEGNVKQPDEVPSNYDFEKPTKEETINYKLAEIAKLTAMLLKLEQQLAESMNKQHQGITNAEPEIKAAIEEQHKKLRATREEKAKELTTQMDKSVEQIIKAANKKAKELEIENSKTEEEKLADQPTQIIPGTEPGPDTGNQDAVETGKQVKEAA
jgi:hypothetical protein